MIRLGTITPGSFSDLRPSIAGLSIARTNRRRSKLARAVVSPIELLEGRVLLSSVVVNSTSDSATGSGIITLRDAIATADSSTSPTTITFDSTVFAAAQTITLTGGQLELSNTQEATTITAPASGLTLDGNNASRIFYIDQDVTAAMSGLTFANGAAVTAGFPADRGGAIENYTGNLQIADSLFVNNTALSYGGAINEDGGSLTLINDTLTGNMVTGPAANPTGPGAGGAISVAGTVTLEGDTIADNTAPLGGGIVQFSNSGATFSLANTIVADNTETQTGAGDAYGAFEGFVSLGHNLIGNTAGSSGWTSGDLTGTDVSPLAADLGSLANNGGPTKTLLPLTGSPAIGAGSVALITSGVTTDQRGMPRTINGAVDIGAVEVGGATTRSSSVVVNSISDTATGSGIVTLRDAIATADSSTSPTTITFDPTIFAIPQTIVLDGTQLELSNTAEPTTITGPAAGVTLSGNNASRIFYIDQDVTAAMSGLTFANGAAVTAGFPADRGGAIENYTGNLQITDSLFMNNTALNYGGAINEDGGSLTLINDTLTGNTVTDLTAANPPGPGCGGAISVSGAVVLNGVTITGNTAANGGGICENSVSGDPFSLANTIVAGNTETAAGAGDATGVEDQTGAFLSLGNNLIGNTAGSSGWIGSDRTGSSASPLAAGLGSLANNGGPTETLLPLAGSPAIGAGSVALIPSGVTTDQRGMPRTINGAVDIGAVEVGGLVNDSPLVPAISGRLPSKPIVAGGKITAFSQIIRVTNTSSSPISGEIMVSLLLSNDPSGASGGTSTASVMHKLTNLKPGKFVSVPVAVHSLPASPVGSLYILPEVTDSSGETAFSASAGTISVAAPFIDLQPLIVRAPASVKAGEAHPVIVTLINNGNSTASGPLAIDLQASTDGAIDSTSIDMGTITRPNVVIKPGKKLVVALVETFPSTGGPYYIVADVDPNNTFDESTLANNVLSSVTTAKLI